MIELLQGTPGTAWHIGSGIAFHHWAYAPDDPLELQRAFVADSRSVDLMHDVDTLAESPFAYFVRDGRTRMEICSP